MPRCGCARYGRVACTCGVPTLACDRIVSSRVCGVVAGGLRAGWGKRLGTVPVQRHMIMKCRKSNSML